jgi:hypothetical protein
MEDVLESEAVTPVEALRLRSGVQGMLAERAIIAAAQARLIRHQAAAYTVALEQVSRASARVQREREMPVRSLAAEVACAMHVHDVTAQNELDTAHTLVTRFAATVDALEAGRVSKQHVAVIHETGARLVDDEVRGAWETVVLDFASREAPGRTKAFARQLAEKLDPVGMTERHAAAAEDRDVSVLDLDDGMSQLIVLMESTRAHAIRDRLTRQARIIRDAAAAERARRQSADAPTSTDAGVLDGLDAAGAAPADEHAEVVDDVRRVGQIRADLVADMLLTGSPTIDPDDGRAPGGLGAIRAHVQVVIPVSTLTGATDAGATVNGQVPVDPHTARWLAGDAPGWDRLLCDPVTGTIRAVDRYTPVAAQRRHIQARDQHCRMPGCRQPAQRCQIDHNHEFHDGGATDIGNLALLCTRHHTLKTETEWTVRQLADGTLEFTSPLAEHYTEKPPPRVVFVPDDRPPPF